MAHASHPAGFTNVSGHTLEGHDGHGSGVFRDGSLLCINDVHDDAALLHPSKASLD
jgi:hypothetical protein